MHFSYLQPMTEPWVVLPGGRCITLREAEENCRNQVQCPKCERWLQCEDGYYQHYWAAHLRGDA